MPTRRAPPRSLRAARAEGHGGDGSDDPRHRHRAGAGRFAAGATGRAGDGRAHVADRRGERPDPLRVGHDRDDHGQPRHRGKGPHARHHAARRVHPPRLHRPGHPHLSPREPAVHDEPQGHSLLAGLARRAPAGAPRKSPEARDPASHRRASPAAGRGEGRAEPRRGSHVARDGPRDRADDPRRHPRDRVAEGAAVERSLGLMCGAGELPALMASEARRQGWRVVAFAFAPDTGAAAHAARVVPSAIAEMAPVITALQEEMVTGVLFSGKFWMGDLLRAEAVDDTHRAMARRAGGLLDGAIKTVLLSTLGGMGIELLDQRPFLGAALPGEAVLGARTPTPDEWADVRRGLPGAPAAPAVGIGQTVVVRRGAVSAVEAIEGTTAAIRRGTALSGRGAVIVKAVGGEHDFRLDVPTIGAETIDAAAQGRAP